MTDDKKKEINNSKVVEFDTNFCFSATFDPSDASDCSKTTSTS